MWGKLSWEAVPLHEPIVMITSAVVAITISAVLAWVIVKGHLPYIWKEWLSSVDHKRIGVMYIVLALVMLLRGFADAIMMRSQQAVAMGNAGFLPPEHYNQIFSAHGTIMIFFVAMPFVIGLMNFAVPLQLGARDVAFPVLNSVGFWLTATGALLVNISLFIGDPIEFRASHHADDHGEWMQFESATNQARVDHVILNHPKRRQEAEGPKSRRRCVQRACGTHHDRQQERADHRNEFKRTGEDPQQHRIRHTNQREPESAQRPDQRTRERLPRPFATASMPLRSSNSRWLRRRRRNGSPITMMRRMLPASLRRKKASTGIITSHGSAETRAANVWIESGANASALSLAAAPSSASSCFAVLRRDLQPLVIARPAMLPRHDRTHLRRDTGERLAGLSDGTGQQERSTPAPTIPAIITYTRPIAAARGRRRRERPPIRSGCCARSTSGADHVREQRGGNQQEHDRGDPIQRRQQRMAAPTVSGIIASQMRNCGCPAGVGSRTMAVDGSRVGIIDRQRRWLWTGATGWRAGARCSCVMTIAGRRIWCCALRHSAGFRGLSHRASSARRRRSWGASASGGVDFGWSYTLDVVHAACGMVRGARL